MTTNGGGWRDLEFQLGQFLAREAKREREGKTIEKLFDEVEKIREEQSNLRKAMKKLASDRLEDKAKIGVHGRAIKTLQAQVQLLTERSPSIDNWRPDASEITGVHALKEVQKAQAELEDRLEEDEERKRENATWWKRQGWIWAFAIITLVVGGTLSACTQLIIHRIEKSDNTAPHAR